MSVVSRNLIIVMGYKIKQMIGNVCDKTLVHCEERSSLKDRKDSRIQNILLVLKRKKGNYYFDYTYLF